MVVYLSLRTRCMRAGVRRIRAGGIGSGWSRACELPSCIGQIVTRSCTRYSRAVGAAAAGAPKPRGRRIGTCSHTAPPARHSGGHSSGRPSRSHTWHHSCRTYFVMYICVLRDLTGTTRLCDHIVRMLLAALSGVTARTLGRRAEKRCEVAVAPRRHGHTVHGTKLAAAKRHRQRAGLQDYSPVGSRKSRDVSPHKKPKKESATALWTESSRFSHTRTSRLRFAGTLI